MGEEDETFSHFRSSLDHWSEMNLSEFFTEFVRRVGPGPTGGGDRVLAVACLSHYGGLRLTLQDLAQAHPDQRLVIGDQQRDHSGNSTRTGKPPPRRGDRANFPPARLTRSWMRTR